jgi:hypothetical protein
MDSLVLAQFVGLDNNIYSWIIYVLFFLVFFLFYPRLMLSQIIWKIEKVALNMEEMSSKARRILLKEVSKNPDKKLKQTVNRFFEFFFIQPASLDPMGSVKRLDHLLKNQKNRFDYFVNEVAPKRNNEEKANIKMGFAAGISLYELTKIVRHFVELAKKTKSMQIAMVVQMQRLIRSWVKLVMMS